MKYLILSTLVSQSLQIILHRNDTSLTMNTTDPAKDMYVIHAMVYQVGIITNKTDVNSSNRTGNQEALTLYRTNGSNFDLSSIPAPLLTNITAQSIVQVAPKQAPNEYDKAAPQTVWNDVQNFAPESKGESELKLGNLHRFEHLQPSTRSLHQFENNSNLLKIPETSMNKSTVISNFINLENLTPALFNNRTVKTVTGAAVVPQGAEVQSIGIPPLVTLNNNLSNIPVPIPNTSVVRYAKINTVVREA